MAAFFTSKMTFTKPNQRCVVFVWCTYVFLKYTVMMVFTYALRLYISSLYLYCTVCILQLGKSQGKKRKKEKVLLAVWDGKIDKSHLKCITTIPLVFFSHPRQKKMQLGITTLTTEVLFRIFHVLKQNKYSWRLNWKSDKRKFE